MPRKRGKRMNNVELGFVIAFAVIFGLYFIFIITAFIRMEIKSNREYKRFRAETRRLMGLPDDTLF